MVLNFELVNQMMSGSDKSYVDKMAANAAKYNTRILLIMIDGAGSTAAKTKSNDKIYLASVQIITDNSIFF